MTNGLSNCDHIRGGNPRAKITTTYMRQKSLMSQRSTPLFRALESMFGGILSKSERDMYPLVSLSFVACVIENLSNRPLKVTQRCIYDLTTSTC